MKNPSGREMLKKSFKSKALISSLAIIDVRMKINTLNHKLECLFWPHLIFHSLTRLISTVIPKIPHSVTLKFGFYS